MNPALLATWVGLAITLGGTIAALFKAIYAIGQQNAFQARENADMKRTVEELRPLKELASQFPNALRRIDQLEDTVRAESRRIVSLEKWRAKQEGRRQSQGEFG